VDFGIQEGVRLLPWHDNTNGNPYAVLASNLARHVSRARSRLLWLRGIHLIQRGIYSSEGIRVGTRLKIERLQCI
jgi:hypothetical protein